MLYELMHEWYNSCVVDKQLSPNTCRCYQLAMQHIKRFYPDRSLDEIDEWSLQVLLNTMGKEHYSKSTIDKVRIVLRGVCAFGYRKGEIKTVPFYRLEIPKNAPVKIVDALTTEEQDKVQTLCLSDKVDYGHITLFLLNTGIRADELYNLKWHDYCSSATKPYIKIVKSKTHAGQRIVPVNSLAKKIIDNQPRINDYIFTTLQGNQVNPKQMSKHNKKIRELTGIKNFNNHICRHSFATRCLEKGMNVNVLSKVLGHTSVAFTMQRYTTIFNDLLFEQIKLIDV